MSGESLRSREALVTERLIGLVEDGTNGEPFETQSADEEVKSSTWRVVRPTFFPVDKVRFRVLVGVQTEEGYDDYTIHSVAFLYGGIEVYSIQTGEPDSLIENIVGDPALPTNYDQVGFTLEMLEVMKSEGGLVKL